MAAYLTLLGGAPYYLTLFPIRVLHHVVMTALLAGWLIHRIRIGRGLPRTPLDLWLVGVAALYGIATITSRDPRVSFEVLWFPLHFLLAYYVMAALIEAGRTRLLLEAQFLMAAVVVIAAGMQLASWWFGLNLVPETSVGWNAALGQGILPLESPRLYLPLGVTTWLAAYTAPLALFAVVKGLTEQQRDLRVGLGLLAVLLVVVMLLTGSRGGVISLGAAGAVLILLRILSSDRFRRLSRTRQLLFVMTPALVFALLGAGVLLWTQTRGSDGSDRLRLGLWRGAIDIISDAPLTGVGPGMFGRVYREVRDPEYVDDRLGTAHNVLLNTAAETGIVSALLLVGIGGAVTQVWWRRWRKAQGAARLRLEGAFSALVGFVVQSQFDLFTATPIILLIVLLTAYICVEPDRIPSDSGTRIRLAGASAALIAVAVFGVVLLNWDRAHGLLLASVRDPGGDSQTFADEAAAIDPGLRLYPLWSAYLRGDSQSLTEALALEPTWDIGWLHVAETAEQAGDYAGALAALGRVRSVSWVSPGALHWARIAEQEAAAPTTEIVSAYRSAIDWAGLPLSEFWNETPLRREALLRYMDETDLDLRYRVAQVHFPERLDGIHALALESESGSAWWVQGESALTVTGDAAAAVELFQRAVAAVPSNGDYRASLARAQVAAGQMADAEAALLLADLLGTAHEYPNAIRAQMAATLPERQRWWAAALPPRVQSQNFEGLLYLGRVADFQIPAIYQFPGPGTRAMQSWYDLAQSYLDAADADGAVNVLRAIIAYAPDETNARQQLDAIVQREAQSS